MQNLLVRSTAAETSMYHEQVQSAQLIAGLLADLKPQLVFSTKRYLLSQSVVNEHFNG
jgi:hypothetical protein